MAAMKKSRPLISALALALVLLLPFGGALSGVSGAGAAFAKGGDGGGDSGGGDGDSGHGGDDGDDGGDDGDNSGRDDSGHDESGRDDDDRDDDDRDDDDNAGGKNASDGKGRRGSASATRIESLPDGARLTFPDGSREEIRNGNFSRFSAGGRLIERRGALGSDIARFKAREKTAATGKGKVGQQGAARVVKATYRGADADLLYSNGWREIIRGGRYMMQDAFGRTVVSRVARQEDVERVGRFRR